MDGCDPTKELLNDGKSYQEALSKLLSGDCDKADTRTTQMWEFIWLELMPKVVPAPGKSADNLFHAAYHHQVDAAALMKHVNVSDEALVLTILSVKGHSFTNLAEEDVDDDDEDDDDDDDSTSQLTANSADKENHAVNSAASTSSGKRKGGLGNGE